MIGGFEMKLLSIRLRKEYDDNPDLDMIGRYSNEWKEGAIETKRDGRYLKYFHPMSSEPEYAQQEFEFMEGIERGEHIAYCVYAEAEIEILGVSQYIRSGALYGIWDEVDQSTYQEEYNELTDILLDMGISQTEISGITVVNADE